MLQGIVFDMDGVLFDTERLMMDVWYEIADCWNLNRDMVGEALRSCMGLNRLDTELFFAEHFGSDFPFEKFRNTASAQFHSYIEENGLPVKAGVYELLEYLRTSDLRVGLASSTGTESVKKHLETAELTQYFETVIGGDLVEHSKPLPDIYLLACQELGLPPEVCMAIEDSPNGIRSAHAAGMLPVMVPDLIEPDKEIHTLLHARFDSLNEVRQYLKERISG